MKGFAFYAEMPESQGSKSGSKRHSPFTRATLKEAAARGAHVNVCAIVTEGAGARFLSGRDVMSEGFTSVYGRSNSPVNWGAASRDYLRTRCVKIDESTARRLHPALFERLDAAEA